MALPARWHQCVQLASRIWGRRNRVCSGVNLELVKSLGASQVIDYKGDFTKTAHLRVIFDAVGKLTPAQGKKVLRPGGVTSSHADSDVR